MTDQQIATTTANPQRQALAKRLTARVRQAVELMVWDGKPYNEAATESGLTVRAMRLALARPHVMAFYKAELQVLRTSQEPRSIIRLAEIRDAANNMPAVQAAKHLLETEQTNSNSSNATSPGVTIRILNQTAVVAAVPSGEDASD
jgi:hypothetical protein